jgi:SWI/SNF-related matrix-associated actin-dependent regulator of chromatin subfamily A-like protein 1
VRITLENNNYVVADAPFEMAAKFKKAGFGWERARKVWVTPFSHKADAIEPGNLLASQGKRWEMNLWFLSQSKGPHTMPNSRTPDRLFPYQKAGVEYLCHLNEALLADEPGLGKTAQAIVYADLKQCRSVLVVCPASLTINWLREFSMWHSHTEALDLCIISYGLLKKNHQFLRSKTWDLMILDECHYVKESQAQRTQEIIGNVQKGIKPIKAMRKVAISGTPIVNRPIELFTTLRWLNSYAFPDKHKFALRYCGAKRGVWGWDYSGSSHLDELQKLLRGRFMVRRLKKDVLPQLPAKIRQVIEIEAESRTRKVLKAELEFLGLTGKEDLTDEQFAEIVSRMQNPKMGPEHIATIRRETAVAKVPAVIEHIKEVLDEEDKVVVFAHHKEVIERLVGAFGQNCVVVAGANSSAERQQAVDRFQTDPACRVFLGNIVAAGVGITLTASSRVIFAEGSWVPGENSQAEDRCHRIGQKESVLVQHIVLEGSLDALIMKAVVKKQSVLDKAMNTNEAKEIEELLK